MSKAALSQDTRTVREPVFPPICTKLAAQAASPIADPDYHPEDGQAPQPILRGVHLPEDVLRQVYHDNAVKLLGPRAGNLQNLGKKADKG